MISWLQAAIIVAAVFGLNIGSFLNVVIWRLPRGGSLSSPTWSYCPRCEHRLGALDLFPVFSFLLLRARCRYCRAPISWRYPGIELLTGILFAAVAWRLGGGQDLRAALDIAFGCAFVSVLICVFFIDLEHFIIPDGLNVAGFLIGLAHWGVVSWLVQDGHWFRISFTSAVSYAAVFVVIGLISYMVLVGLGEKQGFFRSGWFFMKETALDWAYITLDSLANVVPPLRRFVEPPVLEGYQGYTADEIEGDKEEGGVGNADAKLALALGANLLWPLWLLALAFAIILGCVQGLIVMVVKRRRLGQRTAIPFGPALVVGALIALFFGLDIWHHVWAWYVQRYLSFSGSPFASGSYPT